MSYCINPLCQNNDRPDNQGAYCNSCGTALVLNGRYRVQNPLTNNEAAASGFGYIYEILEGSQSKILKVLLYHHNSNPKAVELFQQEAAVLRQLQSSGIPKIDGYFVHNTQDRRPLHCIVMEKIDGVTLEQWMQQQGNEPISDKKALDWLEEVVKILGLVHGKNYFHRDIKPANIMLRRTGELVLIDFGTARDMAGSYMQKQGQGNLTRISSAGFTPNEQRDGQAVLQSDFFALGRTFTQLLTAKHPLDMYVPAIDEFRWRQYTQNSLSALLDLIDKMMARRPVERHQDTSELLRDIAKVRKALPVKRTNVQVVKRQGLGRRDVFLLLGGSSFAAIVAWENLKPKPKVVTVQSPIPNPQSPVPETPRSSQNEPTPPSPTAAKQLQTQTLNNIITVNASGQEVSRTSSTIQYFTEALNLPNGAVSIEMALIPKGTFTMGASSSEKGDSDESPQHEVNFPQDFYMGRYTVTQAQWLAVMGKFSSEFNSLDAKFKGNNLPMVLVSWHEAREFCKKLTSTSNRGTYRLPTEAEWEYACRAGTTTPFHFGETITPSLVNYNGNNPYANAPKGEYRQQTVDVNSFTPNAWGLHQMHGNVREWCLNEYYVDSYSYSKKSSNLKNNGSEPYSDMNVNENDNRHLLRGGSWSDVARNCRAALRNWGIARLQDNYNGLRLFIASSP